MSSITWEGRRLNTTAHYILFVKLHAATNQLHAGRDNLISLVLF